MEFLHTFYKELPVDEDNIFSLNLSENNKVDSVKFDKPKKYEISSVKFDKPKKYEISGLSINQSTGPGVLFLNVEGKKALNNILRTHAAKKDKCNLDLRTYKKVGLILPFPVIKEQTF